MYRNLALFLLFAMPGGGSSAANGSPLSDEEKAFCQNEIEIVEKRRKIFEAQGLSAFEIARRNDGPHRDLAECRQRFQARSRGMSRENQDAEEVARRTGPDATPLERAKALAEVRRERLSSLSPSLLTPEEKAELAAGMAEEMETTHQMMDTVHSRDPKFMRVVHSALACFHTERREELIDRIASEENLIKLGSGDKQTLYTLRSELKTSEVVLAQCREASRHYEYGLDRCTTPPVALVAQCVGIATTGKQQPTCEAEDVQQYLRLVR